MSPLLFSDNLAIVAVFGLAGIMLKVYLTHREKMKALSAPKQTLAQSPH
jgi:hypothetical protein